MFKIIHTADWHLGQRFAHFDRMAEQQRSLYWLLDLIEAEQPDALIIAGDVFDVKSPPNWARAMWFSFLVDARARGCRHIVVVGGNHDSPDMLNSPSDLAATLGIHIVGSATAALNDQILPLHDEQGRLQAVVAAVPFLRSSDLRKSISGETTAERENHVRQGIKRHYEQLAELTYQTYGDAGVPIITTGHLHASGTEVSDQQTPIYVGNLENIDTEDFPAVYDYVALGHIHKAQPVGAPHIRYSGSMLPLSFKEKVDQKVVCIATFDGHSLAQGVREVQVPTFRSLLGVEGTLDDVKAQLDILTDALDASLPELTTWVELRILTDTRIANLHTQLEPYKSDRPFLILTTRLKYTGTQNADRDHEPIQSLQALGVDKVYEMMADQYGGFDKDERQEVDRTFIELRNWMQERKVE